MGKWLKLHLPLSVPRITTWTIPPCPVPSVGKLFYTKLVLGDKKVGDHCYRASFHVLIGHLYIFSKEISIQVLWQFLNWVVCFLLLSCRSFSYILDIKLLPKILFPNIFPHSVGCLLTFLIILWYTKTFNFGAAQFMYFFLLLLTLLVSCIRIHCQIQGLEDLSLCFLQSVLWF